jgi:hypothetical protein
MSCIRTDTLDLTLFARGVIPEDHSRHEHMTPRVNTAQKLIDKNERMDYNNNLRGATPLMSISIMIGVFPIMHLCGLCSASL